MNLTREEMFHANMALSKQHLLDMLANPTRFDWIPDGAHVIGLPQNNRRLFEANMKMAHRLARKGDGQPIILLPEMVKRRVTSKRARAKAR